MSFSDYKKRYEKTMINILPPEIANMIAAGEVVERPASVVKELVENSIDAGATNVVIEIKKGGMTFIRISDNGCGIPKDQVTRAFLRHATSKIKSAEDLNSIYTLGFRGEALASIAAVSRVDIFTKPSDAPFGYSASVEGGSITDEGESGCPDGTTITVRDLFFNTPARMKFLKNDATETSYVTDVVNKMILSHPEVSVKFINNGKTVISSTGDGKLLSCIYTVFGKDYAKNMQEINFSDDSVSVTGYIGNSSISRKDRRHQIFYINNRNVSSKIVSMALSEAFKNTLMTGKFPVAVINISLNTSLVDVNVHPTKMEVRFSDDKKIYSAVYWAVKNSLSQGRYVPEMTVPSEKKVMVSPSYEKSLPKENKDINMLRDDYIKSHIHTEKPEAKKEAFVPQTKPSSDVKPQEKIASEERYVPKSSFTEKITLNEKPKNISPVFEEPKKEVFFEKPEDVVDNKSFKTEKCEEKTPEPVIEEEKNSFPKANIDFKICGQVFNTYIIAQMDNEMLLIDQHAAHERLYFESFLEDFKNKKISPQILLIPITVDFSPTEFDVCVSNKDFFESLGFEMDIFGDRSVIIRQIPYSEEEHIIKDAVSDIVSLLMKNSIDVEKNLVEEALHTMACKRAIKANHELSLKEMEVLVEKVLSLKDINTCPHGRPIMIKMSKYSLEKQFKRIV